MCTQVKVQVGVIIYNLVYHIHKHKVYDMLCNEQVYCSLFYILVVQYIQPSLTTAEKCLTILSSSQILNTKEVAVNYGSFAH